MQLITSISLFSSIHLVTPIYKEETNETEKKEKEETSKEVRPKQIIKVIRREVREQEDNANPNPDVHPGDPPVLKWNDRWTTTCSSRDTEAEYTSCLEG